MKGTSASLIFLLFIALLGAPFASAQNENNQDLDLIITWESLDSYSPHFFRGKTLASPKSQIEAKLLVIDSGQIANLENTEVRWFLNDKLLGSGIGLTEISSSLPQFARSYNELSVVLRQYKGKDFEKSITLPQANPKLIIEEQLFSQEPTALIAHPFFFNINTIDELDFSWDVNNQNFEASGIYGSEFIVDLSSLNIGDLLNINIRAEKISDPLEYTEFNANHKIQ